MKRYRTLTPAEENILVGKQTEPPGSGPFESLQMPGIYVCKRCDAPLYLSSAKFSSGCGWPSFDEELPNAVLKKPDPDGMRTEILCRSCGGHLGHIFIGERLTEKNVRHCVNSLSLHFISAFDEKGFPKAIFAGGCFWGLQSLFQKTPGVLSTIVGYIGGEVTMPSYEEVCSGRTEHAEAIELSFNPEQISYERLLSLFFTFHNPSETDRQGPDIGRQYRSAIFYLTREQETQALAFVKKITEGGLFVSTEVTAAKPFYPAESFHQNYCKKRSVS